MNPNFKKNVKQVLITIALSAATTSAFAVGANYNYPGNPENTSAKTRAEVTEELAQARSRGQSDVRPNQYRDATSYTNNSTRNEASAVSAQPAKRHSDPSSLYFGA
jgi:hypothetical protein